ncbi:MAG: type II secretion system protein GspG [Planctomycetes bacterium]|nr:type II secretion system protein GspG [Planctomycetota bacterium]
MSSSLYLRDRGFSIVETVLAVCLLVSLAALVAPGLVADPKDGDAGAAMAECRDIGAALLRYQRHTGMNPCGFAGAAGYTWLQGPGAAPSFASLPKGEVGHLEWFLIRNQMGGGKAWTGPYLDDLREDPWGRRYVVYVRAWWPDDAGQGDLGQQAWVLSAGPDGIVQTRPDDLVPAGDDVGLTMD